MFDTIFQLKNFINSKTAQKLMHDGEFRGALNCIYRQITKAAMRGYGEIKIPISVRKLGYRIDDYYVPNLGKIIKYLRQSGYGVTSIPQETPYHYAHLYICWDKE